MKIFAVVLTLCIVGAFGALTDEQKIKLRADRDACVTETKVDMAKVDKAYAGEWDEADTNLRCFTACMLKKLGMMDDNGKLMEDITRTKIGKDIPADKVDEVMMKCKDMKGADTCETAMKLMKCYNENRSALLA